jgi:hypothetical protein
VHVECALREADGAHRVVQAPPGEAGLRDVEGLAPLAQQRVRADTDIGVADVRVIADAERIPDHPCLTDPFDARRLGRHQEHRHPFAVSRIRIGHHHDDEECRIARIGGEVLLPVDDPVVAVLHCKGAEQARVGAAVGFGHREGREDLPIEQGLQVAPFLLVGAEHGQDLGVTGIGRLTAENDGTPGCSAQDLVDECELHLAVALTAELRSEVACP